MLKIQRHKRTDNGDAAVNTHVERAIILIGKEIINTQSFVFR